MKTPWFVLCFIVLHVSAYSQQIILDGDFSDWDFAATTTEDQGDNSGLDMESFSITNDDQYLYLHIVFSEEVLLQEGNRLQLQMSGENFEFEFDFGEMEGRIIQSGQDPRVYHSDMGLVISPTHTSKEFELRFARTWNISFSNRDIPDLLNVQLLDLRNGGDRIPDSSIPYTFNTSQNYTTELIQLAQATETFRVCSYNVLRDRIFEDDTRVEYTRILRAISADIYCFQEIYDHSSAETLSRLNNIFDVLDGPEWYHAKLSGDLVTISKYPIIYQRNVSGSGVFVLDMNGKDVMVINIHLACCENDFQREREIDDILKFIKRAQNNQDGYLLTEGTPILIMGDTNFVGNKNQVTALTTGDFFDAGADVQLDWDTDGLATVSATTSGSNTNYTWFSKFSSFAPGRLDYIFYTDSRLTQENAFVFDTEWLTEEELQVNGLEKNFSDEASDHRPVICDFSLIPTAANERMIATYPAIYPNPSTGLITIDNCKSCNWILRNSQGQPLLNGSSTTIDLQNLLDGCYYLELGHETQSEVLRVIKF